MIPQERPKASYQSQRFQHCVFIIRRALVLMGILGMMPVFGKAHAGETSIGSNQLDVHLGMVSGSFSGLNISGSFSVPMSIDVGYEVFSSAKKSTIFRGILSNDLTTSTIAYSYVGVGRRFYFNSTGMGFESSDDFNQISIIPKRRYYAGIELGSSQVMVKQFGPTLQTQSSLIDFGANVGTIFQVSRTVGIDAQLGLGFGYGFSAVSVSGTITKFLLGVTYFM